MSVVRHRAHTAASCGAAGRLFLVALALAGTTGCETARNFLKLRSINAHPVVGPPPSRYQDALDRAGETSTEPRSTRTASTADGPGPVVQVNLTERLAGRDLDDTAIVATVNGSPIFAADLLEPYSKSLEEMAQKAPPEKVRQARRNLAAQHLPDAIDRALLVQALKAMLKPEQQKKLEEHLVKEFANEKSLLMQKLGVRNQIELERELAARGGSLASFEQNFRDNVMAREYLGLKGREVPVPGRAELLAWYREHASDYDRPGRVRWREIRASFETHGGRDAARKVIERAVDELLEHQDFEAAARKHSDGPTAKDGGFWDWTIQGSLADKALDRTLFQMPVGDISPVLESATAFRVVQLLEREDAHRIPFEAVQDEIRETITNAARKERLAAVLKEVRDAARIETIFDGAPPDAP